MKKTCNVCCYHCALDEGQTGACGARKNVSGQIAASNYGKLTALALDPIEKKPLAHFYPGTRILSVGSYGCSLRCPFCQNYEIAAAREDPASGLILVPETDPAEQEALSAHRSRMPSRRRQSIDIAKYTPQELLDLALDLRPRGNIGIAFTYNEPLVGWEFVRDTAQLFHDGGMKTVLVTNGMASGEVLEQILPCIDAMNIDLKGFSDAFYRDFAGGSLEMVKAFIAEAAKSCHIELTKLIIPGKNDSEEEMRQMTAWIAGLRGGRGKDIPLHVSRYFPAYRWREPATEVSAVYRLARIAGETLDHVYTGNC